jgi:predicted esterase
MFIDTGADDSAGTGRMIVDPDKLTQLKKGIEDEADLIREWLMANVERLTSIDPPGEDPCSRDTMGVMGQTGQTAIDKSQAYINRLTTVAEKLHESAVAYGVTEDNNAAAFRKEPQ